MVRVSNIVTSSLHVTLWYTITVVLLFVFLVFCLYLMLKEAHVLNKASFMNIVKGRKNTLEEHQETVQSLFDDE